MYRYQVVVFEDDLHLMRENGMCLLFRESLDVQAGSYPGSCGGGLAFQMQESFFDGLFDRIFRRVQRKYANGIIAESSGGDPFGDDMDFGIFLHLVKVSIRMECWE